jgi:hypothetical protein
MNDENKKGSKGKLYIPWGLYIGIFWKTQFINPPQVRGIFKARPIHLGGQERFPTPPWPDIQNAAYDMCRGNSE